jgi:platelet-activating factor acetylhydrolase
LNTNVSVPILIADSQGWSQTPTHFYGQDHFSVVKSIAETSQNRTGTAWFMTLRMLPHILLLWLLRYLTIQKQSAHPTPQ